MIYLAFAIMIYQKRKTKMGSEGRTRKGIGVQRVTFEGV